MNPDIPNNQPSQPQQPSQQSTAPPMYAQQPQGCSPPYQNHHQNAGYQDYYQGNQASPHHTAYGQGSPHPSYQQGYQSHGGYPPPPGSVPPWAYQDYRYAAPPQPWQPPHPQNYPHHPYPQQQPSPNPSPSHDGMLNGLGSFFNFRDERFVKGAITGAALTFLLTNDSVQKNTIKSLVKFWSMVQGGVEEIKERFQDAEAEIKAEEQGQKHSST